MEYDSQHTQDIFLRPWFTRMWTVQELVMASEPIVVCGSKSMRWNSFFWGMVEALERERNGRTNSFPDAFKSVVSLTSFWYDLYGKEEFSQPVIRTWANNISMPIFATPVARLLDFLENYGRYILYIQGFIALAIASGQIFRGLRPLNTVWILPAILSTPVTLFFRPTTAPSNVWMESLKGKLINVLNMTRYRQASEPQDKVFALYGVLGSLAINLQPPKQNTPFEDVYLDFTRRIINWHNSLDILQEAGIPPAAGDSRLQNTPSWVPDWRWAFDRISLRRCKAAKDSSPDFRFSESGQEILTKGILVDTLDWITSTPANLPDLNDQETSTANLLAPYLSDSIAAFGVWIQRVHRLKQPMVSVPLEDVIFEVLHSNTDPELSDRGDFHDTFRRWYQMVTADYPTLDEIYPMDRQTAVNVANDEVIYGYYRRLLKFTASRRLFTTKQGYVGTGPWDMKMGDVVALITGFGLPIILRGNEEKGYIVMGAAHIHKMMEGEAWLPGEGRLRKIVLI
jgi:hypothetical protein